MRCGLRLHCLSALFVLVVYGGTQSRLLAGLCIPRSNGDILLLELPHEGHGTVLGSQRRPKSDPAHEPVSGVSSQGHNKGMDRRLAMCAMVTERLAPGEHLLEVKVEKPGKTIIIATALWWDRPESPNYATKAHSAHE